MAVDVGKPPVKQWHPMPAPPPKEMIERTRSAVANWTALTDVENECRHGWLVLDGKRKGCRCWDEYRARLREAGMP